MGASSGGAAFADESVVAAYRSHLIPRAQLLTPNRREAVRLLGPESQSLSVPALADALRARLAALKPPVEVVLAGDKDVSLQTLLTAGEPAREKKATAPPPVLRA